MLRLHIELARPAIAWIAILRLRCVCPYLIAIVRPAGPPALLIVAGKIRKWKGRMLDVDLGRLRRELEASRDHIFAQAGIQRDLFRAPWP